MTTYTKTIKGRDYKITRTHHRWLHPTKGWREFARQTKTNGRRKLIRQGALMVPLSNRYRRMQAEYLPYRQVLSTLRRIKADFAEAWKRRF